MIQLMDRFCPSCHGWHPVEIVSFDGDGFPDEFHQLTECLAALLEGLAAAAGRVMALQLDAGNWPGVEAAATIALELNDDPPEAVSAG